MSRALPALLIGMALLAGCTSEPATTPTNTPTPTSAPTATGTNSALCQAGADLKTSINNLTQLSLSSGISGVQNALADIQAKLGALQTAAQGQLSPQISALRTALDNAKSALSAAAASPGASAIQNVAAAVASVVSAAATLQNALKIDCG